MPKPKFLKPLIYGVTGISLVGLVVGLSINWSQTKYIQAVGSSGVKPFIEAFGTDYHKKHDKIEVVVEAGGTTFAVEQVAKGYAQIGNASNNPYYTIFPNEQEGEFSKSWANKKTLTLGWEGLAILYKMPDGLSENAKAHFDIMISKDNILDFYAVFSGFNESMLPDGSQPYHWSDDEAKQKNSMMHYLTQDALNNLTEADKEILLNKPIFPLLRSGGNTAANASIAFTYYSNLVDFKQLTPKQQNAFKGGQYGHDHKFGETDEANSKAWELFSTQNKDSSMTYITTGFLAYEGNRELMKEKGYKLASYLPLDKEEEKDRVKIISDDYSTLNLNTVCSVSGYNWFRPINVMIDLDNDMAKDFIYWLFTGSDDKTKELAPGQVFWGNYYKTMRERGSKPLSYKQFISMTTTPGGSNAIYDALFNPVSSDINLRELREVPADKNIFGALEYEGYIPWPTKEGV